MSPTTSPETQAVAIRRNVWLSGAVAGLAALLGLAYLVRGSSILDTVAGVALVLLAILHATALVSSRAPVLLADDQGIRLRLGLTWRGLPWGSVRQVVVERGDTVLREGRLVVVPRDPSSTLDYLGSLGRLHLRWNQFWYGAPLSVPLGMSTVSDSTDLAGDLGVLAGGRADVVQLRGNQLAQLDEVPASGWREVSEEPADSTEQIDVEPTAESEPVAVEQTAPETAPEPLPAPVAPVRPLSQPARAEVRLDIPALSGDAIGSSTGSSTGTQAGHVPAQREPGELAAVQPDLEHAETWEEMPVEIEVDDLTVHAPSEPVIGPKIIHAREMLDMSIEELSQRTRIRPHVIEAIETDDFAPCGGDFYARGHLTAIARVLGLTIEPLMKEYDDRYAHGPINARRVFEAELSTGLSGGMRATLGGPRWSLLIGTVLCLTMVWGLARLFSDSPEQLAAPSVSTSNDSAGLAANRQPITSPLMKTKTMTVTAAHAAAHVVVRDRTGRILWSGDLSMGRHRQVAGLAPFKVESDNAGAVEVTVLGKARGTIGMAGQPGAKRFG
jgi:cytoskeleton protein RodZ